MSEQMTYYPERTLLLALVLVLILVLDLGWAWIKHRSSTETERRDQARYFNRNRSNRKDTHDL